MGNKLPKVHSNWKVVVLSLAVATTFWFFNALSKDYEAEVEYPLEFEFAPDSVVVVDPLPEYIRLEVSGGGWDLLRRTTRIGATPVVIKLDNPTEVKLLPKNNLQRIISEQMKDVTVQYILTDSLFINIEPEISRFVIVKVDSAAIDLEDNHRITSPIDLPVDTILITGPESLVNRLRSPYLIQIGEKEIDNDFEEALKIPLPNKSIMQASPPEAYVSFKVEEFKEMSLSVPIEQLNFDSLSRAVLLDSTVTVKFMVAASKEDDASADDFTITADLLSLNTQDSTINLISVLQPDYADNIILEKEKVKVSYKDE
ncbi:MAG: hypothetical protein AAGJ93_08130 [Bacteroidota bacterium]